MQNLPCLNKSRQKSILETRMNIENAISLNNTHTKLHSKSLKIKLPIKNAQVIKNIKTKVRWKYRQFRQCKSDGGFISENQKALDNTIVIRQKHSIGKTLSRLPIPYRIPMIIYITGRKTFTKYIILKLHTILQKSSYIENE